MSRVYRVVLLGVILFLGKPYLLRGQVKFDNLNGTWVSKNNKMIIIKSLNKRNNSLIDQYQVTDFNVSVKNDTLDFQHHYIGGSSKKHFIDHYKFKILNVNDSILLVKPLSELAVKKFKTSKKLRFKKQNFLTDKGFVFRNLNLEVETRSYKYWLTISKTKKIRLKYKMLDDEANEILKIQTAVITSELSTTYFEKLIHILIKSRIRKLSLSNKANCYPCATKSIQVVYRGGEFSLKGFKVTPFILQDLIDFLSNVKESVEQQLMNKV